MRNQKIKIITRTALMAAVICVVSPFSIPIGSIPITLSLFAVMFTGIILPPISAVGAVAIYILLGMVGLPVFSGGASGLAVLVGPTGGYIYGYIPMTLIISLLFIPVRRSSIKILYKNICYFSVCLFSIAVCYAAGTIQFVLLTGYSVKAALSVCVVPFIAFDILKAVFAVFLGEKTHKIISKNP